MAAATDTLANPAPAGFSFGSFLESINKGVTDWAVSALGGTSAKDRGKNPEPDAPAGTDWKKYAIWGGIALLALFLAKKVFKLW